LITSRFSIVPRRRRVCAPWIVAAAAAAFAGAAVGAPPPPIRHVFVVMLENQPFDYTFGAKSQARYLKALPRQGALAVNYFATSHASLGNYLALISGQAPNESTNLDCEVFEEFVATGTTADGQAIGKGCVYPPNVTTLANQLEASNLTWKGYMEDMGNNPRRESASCGHPPLGAPDNTQSAELGDQYAARHNPFVYFHAIIDTPSCDRHVLNLSALASDLKSVGTTPNYSFIVPNLCHDAHDGTGGGRCVDGAPGGLVAADEFLSHLVPKILASPAYRRDGLLIITFDESDLVESLNPRTGATVLSGDGAACCNEPSGPNIPPYTPAGVGTWERMNGPGIIGPGGGRVGAVMLSPYIRPGSISMAPYNHYALLKSVEDLFHLPHLGYAAQPGLEGFGADLYTRPVNARN
jgi:phosphatidylinositol-3-phosphatase